MKYTEIPFWKFCLALGVLAIPAAIAETAGSRRWAMTYAFMILFVFAAANMLGIEKLIAWTSNQLKR